MSNNVISIFTARKQNTLWWEEPLDEFVGILQALYHNHSPYFSQAEMEEVYNEVSLYVLQRGKLWEDYLKTDVSPAYLEYLASDLTGYLRQIYVFLKEDIMDRKKEYHAANEQKHSNIVAMGIKATI